MSTGAHASCVDLTDARIGLAIQDTVTLEQRIDMKGGVSPYVGNETTALLLESQTQSENSLTEWRCSVE
jgi:hypothetical protein